MNTSVTKKLADGAIIAALYTLLTLLSSVFGLSIGPIQLRLSEALCILPCFTPAAIPGLFIGCLLGNLLSGATIWDILFGSIATLIGAVGTYALRKKHFAAFFPPIAANTLIIPFILSYAYGLEEGIGYFFLSIGISEFLSAGLFGHFLRSFIRKRNLFRYSDYDRRT